MRGKKEKKSTTGIIGMTSMGTGYITSERFPDDVLIEPKF